MPITKLNLPQPGTPEYDDIIRRFEAKEKLEGHIDELVTRLPDAAQRRHESDHDHHLRMKRLKSEVTQENKKHLAELTERIADAAKCQTDGIDQPVTIHHDDVQKLATAIGLDTVITADNRAEVEATLRNLRKDTQTKLDDDRQFLINYAQQQGRDAQRLMEIAERLSSG